MEIFRSFSISLSTFQVQKCFDLFFECPEPGKSSKGKSGRKPKEGKSGKGGGINDCRKEIIDKEIEVSFLSFVRENDIASYPSILSAFQRCYLSLIVVISLCDPYSRRYEKNNAI